MALRDEYFTPAEAAKYANVNRLTIRRWFQTGRIRGEQIGNITLVRQTDVARVTAQRLMENFDWSSV